MRTTTPPNGRSFDRSTAAWTIVVLGLISGALALEHALTHPDPLVWWAIDLAAAAVLPGGLMYAGYRLARTDFEPDELWTVARWCFAGVVSLTLIGGWILLSQVREGGSLGEPMFMVLMLAVAGAIAGLTIGVRETNVAHAFGAISQEETEEADEATDSDAERRQHETDGPSVRRRIRSLDDPERWLLVECLATRPGDAVGLRELAELVARRAAADGTEASADRVAARLHHVHLPTIAAEGLCEYDAVSRTVEYDGEKLSDAWIDER